MNLQNHKSKEFRITNQTKSFPDNGKQSLRFIDNRPEATTQLKAQQMADDAISNSIIQKEENKTGMPDQLKTGFESFSGLDMSDVKVHCNSSKPGEVQAHAYTQGTDIHVASGQEKHLAHEAWHVVQQKQGRVKTTVQMKGGVNLNDDAGLENEGM